MSDKIELMRLCGVLQSNFSCLGQSKSRTQPCHVRIRLNHLLLFPPFIHLTHPSTTLWHIFVHTQYCHNLLFPGLLSYGNISDRITRVVL